MRQRHSSPSFAGAVFVWVISSSVRAQTWHGHANRTGPTTLLGSRSLGSGLAGKETALEAHRPACIGVGVPLLLSIRDSLSIQWKWSYVLPEMEVRINFARHTVCLPSTQEILMYTPGSLEDF